MRKDCASSSGTSLHSDTGGQSIETLIEKYVRFPDELEANVHEMIRDAVESDPTCKALLEFYESVYAELDLLPTKSSSQLEAFISSIFPSTKVVPLFPLDEDYIAHARLSVLLPGVNAKGKMVIRTPLVLLGSKESRIVVVFLHDIDRPDQWRAQVYSSDPADRTNVLLTVPELALDLFVADVSADFTLHGLRDDLDSLESAILHVPMMHARRTDGVYTGDLPQTDEDALEMPSGHILRFREQDDLLLVELDGSRAARATAIRRIALTAEGRPTRILRVATGYDVLSIEHPAKTYDIWFFE